MQSVHLTPADAYGVERVMKLFRAVAMMSNQYVMLAAVRQFNLISMLTYFKMKICDYWEHFIISHFFH